MRRLKQHKTAVRSCSPTIVNFEKFLAVGDSIYKSVESNLRDLWDLCEFFYFVRWVTCRLDIFFPYPDYCVFYSD